MERFWGFDTWFSKIMTRIADLIILNVLFMISCIPVFTIGSAVAALYTVTMQMCRDEESYIIKEFWGAFRNNFKKATMLWGIIAGTGLLICTDFRMFGIIDSDLLKGGIISVAFLWILIVPYLIPVVVGFRCSIIKTLYVGTLLSLRHVGSSFMIFLIHLLLMICVLSGGRVFYHLLAFLSVTSFSGLAYMYSNIYIRIFERYITYTFESE